MSHWQHPFPEATITSGFGTRRNRKSPHRGVDYAPGAKSLIPAVTNGRVELIQWSDILGWVMVQSSGSGKYYIGYCHLNCAKHGLYCRGPLDKCTTPFKSLGLYHDLKKGQPVGRVGSTGSASTGPHLHITLGKTVRAVFYGQVYDIQAYINKQLEKHGLESKETKKEKVKPTLGSKYGRFWRLLK